VIGVQPENAAVMKRSIEAGKPVEIEGISRFCDGSAVRFVG